MIINLPGSSECMYQIGQIMAVQWLQDRPKYLMVVSKCTTWSGINACVFDGGQYPKRMGIPVYDG